jgi:hypothetical protein
MSVNSTLVVLWIFLLSLVTVGCVLSALSKYEAYGERLRGLAAHRHSHTVLRIHQHCNRRFGHFARIVPRGLGRGEGYGDTVVTVIS